MVHAMHATVWALVLAAFPAQSIREPQLYCVRDVRVVDRDDAPRVTLVLREGRIDSVLDPGAPLPPTARIVEAGGLLAIPGFIDAGCSSGLETPEPTADQDVATDLKADIDIDMRAANRKGVQPAFRAVDAVSFAKKQAETWREQGFGAVLSSPAGELLSGTSALMTTRDAALRDAVLKPEAFAHAAFDARGSGYPSTLMGYHAQLRQFFLDVRAHAELRERFDAGRSGPRPAYDAELEAAYPILSGERSVVCSAETARDAERWIALGQEIGFRVVLSGGRDVWQIAPALAERKIPVILTLNWSEEVEDPHKKEKLEKEKGEEKTEEPQEPDAAQEPDVVQEPDAGEEKQAEDKPSKKKKADDDDPWIYVEPLAVREDRRARWEEERDSALRLHEAGVPIIFGSSAIGAKKLVQRIRTLVKEGLPQDAAMKALTRTPAELCGVERRLGSVAPGFDATFGLWTKDPMAEDAKIAWLFVDGFAYKFDLEEQKPKGPPDEGVDFTGDWEFSSTEAPPGTKTTGSFVMEEDGTVKGTITHGEPGQAVLEGEFKGRVSGSSIELKGSFQAGEQTIDVTLSGEIEGDSFEGRSVVSSPSGEKENEVEGKRVPKRASHREDDLAGEAR